MNFRVHRPRGGFLFGVGLLSLVLLLGCLLMGAGPVLAETPPPFAGKWGSTGTGNGQFSGPCGIAVDNSGNTYVADTANHRIQKFTANGIFVAKWGSNGSGDGLFNNPQGIATDSAGNVYVADTGNRRIQKFSATGSFVTQWGSAGSGDGQFADPVGIAIDSAGNVYVADSANHRIQKFSGSGTFVAAWGSQGIGPGQFDTPGGMAVDSAGNIYIADYGNSRIQKFNTDGAWIMGWRIPSTSLPCGTPSAAHPSGVSVDSSGDVYVADFSHGKIFKYSGNGIELCVWGSSGTADGQLIGPKGLAADKVGNIYVADTYNNRLQKFSYPRTFGFLGKWGQYAYSNLENTDLDHPWGVATDTAGNVYVTNWQGYHLVKKFTSTGGFVTKWGGFGSAPGQFKFPQGISLDGANNVYVADWENRRIQKFNAAGGYLKEWPTGYMMAWGYDDNGNPIESFAGTYPRIAKFKNWLYTFLDFTRNYGWTVKYNSEGSFVQKLIDYHYDDAHDLTVDAQGNLYVCDSGNNRVLKVDSAGNIAQVWGDTSGDRFWCPRGITLDDQGYVYVTDDRNRVQKFTSNGQYVSQWGSYGSGDGQFNHPQGIAFHDGNFYVADMYNHRIQKFGYLPVSHKPIIGGIGNKSVNENETLTFTVNAVDADGGALTYSIGNKPTAAIFDPATRTFTWTPGYNESGVYPNVTFTVTDNSNPPKSATETVTITVGNVNRAPVLTRIGAQTAKEGEPLQFTLSAVDPDGDLLTFSISNPPAEAVFDAQTGAFSWTPSFTQGGQNYSVLFTVTDNGSPPLSDAEEITITVGDVNRPPAFGEIGDKSVDEGKLLEFTLTATDPDENEAALSFAAGNLPAGAAFNTATRTFTWTPGYEAAGEYAVSFTVTDTGGLTDSKTVTIAVGNVNRSPVLDSIGAKTGRENTPLTFSVTGHDPDGDPDLTFSAENLPDGATFAGQTFNWTPAFDQAGNYTVLFTVQDSGTPLGIALESVTITVGNENRAPVFETVGTKQAAAGEKVEFYVQAADPDGDALVYSTGALPGGAGFNPDTRLFSWTPGYSQAGSYTVDFSATDNSSPPLTGKTSVVISVSSPTPSELIAGILKQVTALGLAKEMENSYVANLKKVDTFIGRGQKIAAANRLDAFIKKVNTDLAQGKIDPASGAEFITMATELLRMLGT